MVVDNTCKIILASQMLPNNTAKQQINMSINSPSCYIPENMFSAIENMSHFLLPKPTYEDMINADYRKFSIADNSITSLLDDVIFSNENLRLEEMLLIVESLRTSGPNVKKAMFKAKKNNIPTSVGGNIIFRSWSGHVLHIMDIHRCKMGKEKIIHHETRLEEMVSSSIMGLICDFDVIKDAKQIGILKSKFNVDWNDIVQKVRRKQTFFFLCTFVLCILESNLFELIILYSSNTHHINIVIDKRCWNLLLSTKYQIS